MQPTNGTYPVRLSIRHKAQVKLASAISRHLIGEDIDAVLFQGVTGQLFQPAVHPDIYCAYPTPAAAMAVEDEVSSEIAETYVRLRRQQQDPRVQRLNRLL